MGSTLSQLWARSMVLYAHFLVCGFVHFLVLLNCQCDLELILDLICAFFVSQ